MRVVFHKDFCQGYASDPAAAPGRMEAAISAIGRRWHSVEASPASEEDILAVHTMEHVRRVRNIGVYNMAALAAGGALEAAVIGLEEPCFGLIRPPGHHASAGSCWGFCYFNNMAVALAHLKRKRKIRRAFVLDIDLHFGDGTENILGGTDWAEVHNVQGRSRDRFLSETKALMAGCDTDVIGISAGFDNHLEDWGGTLETEDYEEIGRMVRDAAFRCRAGCFAVLEGGYNHRVLGRNVAALIQGMSAEA